MAIGFTEQKCVCFLTYLKFEQVFHEFSCLYLFQCISYGDSKYGHEIPQFWHFLPNLLHIWPVVCTRLPQGKHWASLSEGLFNPCQFFDCLFEHDEERILLIVPWPCWCWGVEKRDEEKEEMEEGKWTHKKWCDLTWFQTMDLLSTVVNPWVKFQNTLPFSSFTVQV